VHPGGKFVLEHTVGSDVSKFFFGGYSLEGNIGQITPGHNHSSYARMIVNDLAIAIFEQDLTPGYDTLCHVSEELSTIHAPDVKVLHFKANRETAAFKSFNNDTRMLGKHFRVTWTGNELLSRHYTICNVMNPAIYQEYVNALKKGACLSSDVFNSDDRDFQILTAKNYNRPEGLSTKFFS